MKTTVVNNAWAEKHEARYGAPAGEDTRHATIEHHTLNGRVYQTETLYCNGIVTQSGEYPANTPYALKRIAQLAG